MTKQTRKWNPGDAANTFIRVILSDAGTMLGGFTEEEWENTLEYFDGCCAYTGVKLDPDDIERDHAIPMNRGYCGLHLHGNVLPTTKSVNRQKGNKHYDEFVTDKNRLDKVQDFIDKSGYAERVSAFGNLQNYCKAQYETIKSLSRVSKTYLQDMLPEIDEHSDKNLDLDISSVNVRSESKDVLPIYFSPSPVNKFHKALLLTKHAWIVTVYTDGKEKCEFWNAQMISTTSNIVGNIRSRPQFRKGNWQKKNIARVCVRIERP